MEKGPTKKGLIAVGGALASITLFAGVAYASPSQQDEQNPFLRIWAAIEALRQQVANIPAGPQGPKGDTGEQGPQGPQGIPGVSGALADVYGGTQSPDEYIGGPGQTKTWSWDAPEGSFLAFGRINYALHAHDGVSARITCGINKEGEFAYDDLASDSVNLDQTSVGYNDNGKDGSFTLVAPLEFLVAGQYITVSCTENAGTTDSVRVTNLSLQLLPINQFHPLNAVTP